MTDDTVLSVFLTFAEETLNNHTGVELDSYLVDSIIEDLVHNMKYFDREFYDHVNEEKWSD